MICHIHLSIAIQITQSAFSRKLCRDWLRVRIA